MKKLLALSLILVVLSSLSVSDLSVAQSETENVSYFLKSTVRYSNPSSSRVWNLTEREDDRTISLFMNNSWQTVEFVNSTLPVEEIRNDEEGNPVAVLRFLESVLNPGENVSLTVWYHIISKPRTMPDITESESLNLTDIPLSLIDEYTHEEGPWQTSNQALRERAFALKGSETRVLTIIKNFVEWIKTHVSYPSGRHENPYYPNQTYALGEGDCDDQAMLLITFSRIVGIPAYLQTGCIYLPTHFDNSSFWDGHVSMVERRIGWHGWAVVYVPPWGWLPVDLTYVPEGFGDPLNAMKHGAVTKQDTIQYMNVTHTDYVAASLEAREFLANNGFRVYMEDEMIQEVKQGANGNPTTISVDPWVPFALTVLVAFAVVTSFLISRRWRKRMVEEPLTQLDEHL